MRLMVVLMLPGHLDRCLCVRTLLHIPIAQSQAFQKMQAVLGKQSIICQMPGNVLKEPLFSSPDFNRYRSNNKECCVGSFERSILALFAAGPERPALNIVSDSNTKPTVKLRLRTSRLSGQLRPIPDAKLKQTPTKKKLGATSCIRGGGEEAR